MRDMRPSLQELRQAFWPMIRGTAVGTAFGALPGTGPTITTFIAYALEQCRWNRVKTAKMLRISYRALLYKIKDMGLKQDAAAS